jgi:hypothetical protein
MWPARSLRKSLSCWFVEAVKLPLRALGFSAYAKG